MVRCHHTSQERAGFSFGRIGRFRPVEVGGRIVPTLYAADSEDGALAERVFRDLPPSGFPGRHLARSDLSGLCLSRLTPREDLRLGELLGQGPAALGAFPGQLTRAPTRFYGVTGQWAKAIRWGTPGCQGLVWMSRQHDAARALMLWFDRVGGNVLQAVGPPEPIDSGDGLQRVEAFARRAGIVLV